MDMVLNWLLEYEYLAMLGILLLCGIGLPLPEEVTLIGSGLLVGWQDANFWLATLSCSLGILAGDTLIFSLGYRYGQRFLQSYPMRLLLPSKRQARVQQFFDKHGSQALFLARFVPGVRIGVYAYAGSQKIAWQRFMMLDFFGVLISGPTSILIGRWAALAFVDDRDAAIAMAMAKAHNLGYWLVVVILSAVLGMLVLGHLMERLSHRGK